MEIRSVLTLVLQAAPGGHGSAGISPILAGFGLGIALAGAPGPVQAILLTESVRGGAARGFRAMVGANLTFAVLLVALALGLSAVPPSGFAFRALKVVGGAFLLWLALDALRAQDDGNPATTGWRTLPPAVRGTLAVLLNPGAWLFLATAASSLLAAATRAGGTASALAAAVALVIGLATGDFSVVMLGGLGVRRAGERVGLWVRRFLATVLAALGLWLTLSGVIG